MKNIINLVIIFPGNGFYNFNKILYNFKNYNLLIKKNFCIISDILKINVLKLISTNNNLLYKYNINQSIIITISLIIFKIISINLNNINKRINIFFNGYSLGDYSSLVCSNSINHSDIIHLLIYRNKLINTFIKKYNFIMLIVIGINFNIILNICKKINKIKNNFICISIINNKFNCTISGYKISIEKFFKYIYLYKFKYKTIILPFKIPYHSNLLKFIKRKFIKKLNLIEIKFPKFKIIDNLESKILKDKYSIKKNLVKSLYSMINFNKTINSLKKKNINICIEIGSKFLTKFLIKSNIYKFSCKSLNDITNITNYLNNV